ncbi:MAG: serine hydrolase [Sediminibacterium sp.]|nr:serine hydrolase [Sediminibacterium sp.]
MKKQLLFTPFLFSGLLFGCSKSNTIEPVNTAIQQKIQLAVDSMMSLYKAKYPNYPGGIALKVISPKGQYFASSGLGSGTTDQVHFRAASNTKTFTAAAVLLLAQEKKLNLDAKIVDTIPGTSLTYIPLNMQYNIPYKDQITIRDLLQHNAGVYDVTNDNIPANISANVPYKGMNYMDYIAGSDPRHSFGFDELVGVVAQCQVAYDLPRKIHHYSNTGYSILGKIIERVSGKTYSQFLMENIVVPMGLTNTSFPFSGTDQTLPEPFVKGFYFTPAVKECTLSNVSGNIAEGNVITTPENLARFLRNLMRGNGVLKLATVTDIMKKYPTDVPGAETYACGMFYVPELGWGHNGAHEGYLSRMVNDADQDITLVAFTNTWNTTRGMATITEQLNDLLEGTCKKVKLIVQ